MQKLVNFQTSHFKKREQDPNIAKCEKLSINLIMILNGEIKMDGQAQVSISTKISILPIFSRLNGPEFCLTLCDPTVCLTLKVLSLTLHM